MNENKDRDLWEADYLMKGKIYGGAPSELPPFPAGARILEIGCGNGKTLVFLVNRSRMVTAIDFSFCAAQLARAAVPPDSGAEIAVADARTLPFRNGAFDAVTAIHVLGHSTSVNRTGIVREIGRVVRTGGLVLFCEFSNNDFRYGNGKESEPGTFVRGNGIRTHYFTEHEVTGLFYGFMQESLRQETWSLRVRGKEYPRSEIVALFRKPDMFP